MRRRSKRAFWWLCNLKKQEWQFEGTNDIHISVVVAMVTKLILGFFSLWWNHWDVREISQLAMIWVMRGDSVIVWDYFIIYTIGSHCHFSSYGLNRLCILCRSGKIFTLLKCPHLHMSTHYKSKYTTILNTLYIHICFHNIIIIVISWHSGVLDAKRNVHTIRKP